MAAAASIEELPSGQRVTPWWNKHVNKVNNLVDVHTVDVFVACLAEAANGANLEEEDRGGGGGGRDGGGRRLVCVEFFAGWCFACRSLHPKFCKIAANEFPDVLFIRVHKDELPELCDAMGIQTLPYVQMYKGGVDGVVDEFPMNNTAHNLAKFRRALSAHSRRDGLYGDHDVDLRGDDGTTTTTTPVRAGPQPQQVVVVNDAAASTAATTARSR